MTRVYFKGKCCTCGKDILSDETMYYYCHDHNHKQPVCADCIEKFLVGENQMENEKGWKLVSRHSELTHNRIFTTCSKSNEYCPVCPHNKSCEVCGETVYQATEFKREYYLVPQARLIQLLMAEVIKKSMHEMHIKDHPEIADVTIKALNNFDIDKGLAEFRKEKK